MSQYQSLVHEIDLLRKQLADAEDKLAASANSSMHWENIAMSLSNAARPVVDLHTQGEFSPTLVEALALVLAKFDGDDD
jgi:hypothetical protein